MQRSCNVFPSHSTNHGRHIVITGLHLKNLSHGEFETFAKVTQLANIRFGGTCPLISLALFSCIFYYHVVFLICPLIHIPV